MVIVKLLTLSSLLSLVVLALAPGCGSDDTSEEPGSGGSNDGRSSSGASGSTTVADQCKKVRAASIVIDNISADDLELSRDELFFVDASSRELRKYSIKGGAPTVLVKFEASQRNGKPVFVDGDDVYFFMGSSTDSSENLPIHRVARTGGTPTKLATTPADVATGVDIFAADETSLFTTDYKTSIVRISKGTGAAEYLVKGYAGELASPQLYDGKIYFVDVANKDVMAIPKDATNGTPTIAAMDACDRLLSLSVSKQRIVCGLHGMDWSGNKVNFFDEAGRLTLPMNDSLFGYSNDHHTLWEVTLEPYSSKLLACDVNSNYTVVYSTATDVYWLNSRTVDHKAVRSINRASRK